MDPRIRLTADQNASGVTAHFHYRDRDSRGEQNDPLFEGIATSETVAAIAGVMRSLAYDTLGLALTDGSYYELNPEMEFTKVDDAKKDSDLVKAVTQPANSFSVDAASVILKEDGNRYRFPKNENYGDNYSDNDGSRVCREVATECDLLNLCLLYTSPSPRDQRGSRMPSSA